MQKHKLVFSIFQNVKGLEKPLHVGSVSRDFSSFVSSIEKNKGKDGDFIKALRDLFREISSFLGCEIDGDFFNHSLSVYTLDSLRCAMYAACLVHAFAPSARFDGKKFFIQNVEFGKEGPFFSESDYYGKIYFEE